jgi:hypothetical protein
MRVSGKRGAIERRKFFADQVREGARSASIAAERGAAGAAVGMLAGADAVSVAPAQAPSTVSAANAVRGSVTSERANFAIGTHHDVEAAG